MVEAQPKCNSCGTTQSADAQGQVLVAVRLVGEGVEEDGSWGQLYLCDFCRQRAAHLYARHSARIERLLFPV